MSRLPLTVFTGWLANGERGLSSEAIVEHLTGEPVGGRMYAPRRGRLDHPYDMGDFRRCELLLRRVDLARLVFPEMASASPKWAALVDVWGDIVSAAEEENPTIFTERPGPERTSKAGAIIRAAID